MSIYIKLEPWEIHHAAMAGVQRQVQNIEEEAKQNYGNKNQTNWQIAIEGCLGEYAAAVVTGQLWRGKGPRNGPDIGKSDEVRTTEYPNGKLILHPKDKRGLKFWLVTGKYGVYQVRGWIMSQYAIHPDYWDDHFKNGRPCFAVPQEDLVQVRQVRYVDIVETPPPSFKTPLPDDEYEKFIKPLLELENK